MYLLREQDGQLLRSMAKIGFDAVPAWKDLVPAAISLVESHLQLRSHKDRINKLGPDGKTRFERDLNGTILFSFLKAMSQVDKFTGRCSEIQEKLKIESIHSGDEHLQFLSNSIAEVNCVAPTLPEDVAGVLQSMIDVRKQRVSDVLEKIADQCHDHHMPATSWKKNLANDCALWDVRRTMACATGEPNMAPLVDHVNTALKDLVCFVLDGQG